MTIRGAAINDAPYIPCASRGPCTGTRSGRDNNVRIAWQRRIANLKGRISRRKRPKDESNVQMSKAKVPTQVSHRNSKDGQFVTERYANRNPDTTERERIKHPK
jgi:hypothetical protein